MSDTRTLAERIADCTIAKAADSTAKMEAFMARETLTFGYDPIWGYPVLLDAEGNPRGMVSILPPGSDGSFVDYEPGAVRSHQILPAVERKDEV